MPEIKINEYEKDDMSGAYELSRQVAHEYHSDSTQLYLDLTNQEELERQQEENIAAEKQEAKENKKRKEKEFTEGMVESMQRRRGELTENVLKEEEENIQAEIGGIEAPNFDPIMAAAGGFGAMGSLSLNAAKGLMPSLGRALTTGVVSGAGDIVPGVGMDVLEQKAPGLALPFGIAVSLLQGATVENAIERAIRKTAQQAGQKLSKKAVTEMVQTAKVQLANEFGQTGDWKEYLRQYQDFVKDNPKATVDQIAEGTGLTKYQVENLVELSKQNPLDDEYIAAAAKELNDEINKIPIKKSGIPEKPDMEKAADEFLANKSPDITKEYAGNIRLWGGQDLEPKFMGEIETPEDINRIIAGTHETFAAETETARRGVRSWEETAEAAKQYEIEDLLGRELGQAYNAEQIENARTLLVSSSDTLKAMADRVRRGEANDLEKMEFMKAFNLNYAIQMQLSGIAAEAGRALNIFKKVAQTDALRVGQIKDFLQTTTDANISPEKIADAISDMQDPAQMAKFIKQAKRATTYDMFIEAWINGLLSGPVTHAVNSLSNTLVALYQIPERAMASYISDFTGSGITSGEVFAHAYGMIEGVKDGIKAGWKALKTGEGADITTKIEQQQHRAITAQNVAQLPLIRKVGPKVLAQGSVPAFAVDAIGEIIRTPGRFLTAEDEFFKAIGYRMELRAQAYRQASSKGLEGDEAAQYIQRVMENPEVLAPEIHLAGIDAARYQTFTKELGVAGRGLQTAINKSKVGRIIMPFIRTPINILKFTAERGPTGLAMQEVRANLAAGGAKRDLAIARMSLGSMVMAMVGSYAAAGMITGGGPSDPDMRKYLYNQGWQPYSILIGDKYYAYGRLEPMGMMMGLGADFVEVAGELSELERDKIASTMVAAFSRNVMSKTWLRGISETVSALDGPDQYGERYIQRLAGSTIPTLSAQIERQISPEMSDIHSTMDAIKSRVPGYSKDVPARRNLWGEKIILEGGLGPDLISPIYTSKKRTSPIDKELYRLGQEMGRAPVTMPKQVQHFSGVGIRLNSEQYNWFLERMNNIKLVSSNRTLKATLDQYVTKDKDYKRMNNEQKESIIDGTFLEAIELTRSEIMATNKWRFRELVELSLMQRQQAANF